MRSVIEDDIDVEQIAKRLNVSRRQLERLFAEDIRSVQRRRLHWCRRRTAQDHESPGLGDWPQMRLRDPPAFHRGVRRLPWSNTHAVASERLMVRRRTALCRIAAEGKDLHRPESGYKLIGRTARLSTNRHSRRLGVPFFNRNYHFFNAFLPCRTPTLPER